MNTFLDTGGKYIVNIGGIKKVVLVTRNNQQDLKLCHLQYS